MEEIHALASSIIRRGLATPAIVLLELLRPLSFIGSQILLVAEPILSPIFGDVGQRYAGLLEDRQNIARLLEVLEAQSTPSTRRHKPPA